MDREEKTLEEPTKIARAAAIQEMFLKYDSH